MSKFRNQQLEPEVQVQEEVWSGLRAKSIEEPVSDDREDTS